MDDIPSNKGNLAQNYPIGTKKIGVLGNFVWIVDSNENNIKYWKIHRNLKNNETSNENKQELKIKQKNVKQTSTPRKRVSISQQQQPQPQPQQPQQKISTPRQRNSYSRQQQQQYQHQHQQKQISNPQKLVTNQKKQKDINELEDKRKEQQRKEEQRKEEQRKEEQRKEEQRKEEQRKEEQRKEEQRKEEQRIEAVKNERQEKRNENYIDMNNPFIKKLIEQKKNLQKKILLERADKKRLESNLERNIELNKELKREKEKYEIEKQLRKEKRRLKRLMIKKANREYNIPDDYKEGGENSISLLQKRREELINATKEYQKSLNVYNKSDYVNNKEFKGRYAKYLNPIIHNKNINNLKSIIKKKNYKQNSSSEKNEKNEKNKKNSDRSLKFFTKVKIQEFDKKQNFKDIKGNEAYLEYLNDSADY